MAVEYRILDDPTDFERVVDLEITVWGLDPRDAVPASMLRAIQHSGGLVNGAWIDDQLVGMGMMFPVRLGNRWIYWSHMTGVHPDYQRLGIGVGIKQQQRNWTLEQGGDEIRWTFDPLQRGNANFNLHRLGATFDSYLVNFYGLMSDAINNGIASDRVEAVWKLNDPRVRARSAGQAAHTLETIHIPTLLIRDERDAPAITASADGHTPGYLVHLPHSLKSLDRTAVYEWRLALRATLQTAFSAGYRVDDFDSLCAAYILHKS